MSKFFSNYSRESEKNTVGFSTQPVRNQFTRLSWPEGIVSLIVPNIVGYGVGLQLSRLGLGPVIYRPLPSLESYVKAIGESKLHD